MRTAANSYVISENPPINDVIPSFHDNFILLSYRPFAHIAIYRRLTVQYISMSDTIVAVDHFQMKFGNNEVIKDLSFTVKRGETFGLLGSNGSGKTTTIRALLGIYQPKIGRAHV